MGDSESDEDFLSADEGDELKKNSLGIKTPFGEDKNTATSIFVENSDVTFDKIDNDKPIDEFDGVSNSNTDIQKSDTLSCFNNDGVEEIYEIDKLRDIGNVVGTDPDKDIVQFENELTNYNKELKPCVIENESNSLTKIHSDDVERATGSEILSQDADYDHQPTEAQFENKLTNVHDILKPTVLQNEQDSITTINPESCELHHGKHDEAEEKENQIPERGVNHDVDTNEMKEEPETQTKDDWGWNWADDFISQASNSVTTFLEKVEDQLGIPDPVEMAEVINKDKGNKESIEKKYEHKEENCVAEMNPNEQSSSWFSSLMPLSDILQSTGQDIVTGGVGALEYIGKKTVDILSDGDPGLRAARQSFKQSSTLAKTLQEARMKSEKDERAGNVKEGENPARFVDMFEKYQGAAHLEALEMLSNESESKLERFLTLQSDEVKAESLDLLKVIKEEFAIVEMSEEISDTDFKNQVFNLTKKLKVKITCSKLLNTWSKLNAKEKQFSNSHECYEEIICNLAELTSRCIEFNRKVADMLLVTDMDAKFMAKERAETLKLLDELFTNEISVLGNSGVELFIEKYGSLSEIMSEIFLEVSNCSTLILTSHNLLLSILQCSAIK